MEFFQEYTSFPKIRESPQNSRRQKGDMKQLSHLGPMNTMRQGKNWRPGFVHP